MSKENERSLTIQNVLKSHLHSGEDLLGHSYGFFPGVLSSRKAYFGITQDRFLVYLPKSGSAPSKTISFWRKYIEQISWEKFNSRLNLIFKDSRIRLFTRKRKWKKNTAVLADIHLQTPKREPSEGQTDLALQSQIRAFYDLGLISAAHAIVTEDSAGLDSEFLKDITEKRLALKVGAGFMFANVAIYLLLTAITLLSGGLPDIQLLLSLCIEVLIGVNLWRGKAHQWVAWAILRVVLGTLFALLVSVQTGMFLDILSFTAYSAAMIMVLTGRSTRKRTITSVIIFVIGYLGIVTITFLMAFMGLL